MIVNMFSTRRTGLLLLAVDGNVDGETLEKIRVELTGNHGNEVVHSRIKIHTAKQIADWLAIRENSRQ